MTVETFFEGKPETLELFQAIEKRITALGPVQVEVKSQISFSVERKFAWFWLYNVTKKNPSGVLHVMLALGERVDDPHVRDVSKVGQSRWNHQIVIPGMEAARSKWLGELLERAHAYGSRLE